MSVAVLGASRVGYLVGARCWEIFHFDSRGSAAPWDRFPRLLIVTWEPSDCSLGYFPVISFVPIVCQEVFLSLILVRSAP